MSGFQFRLFGKVLLQQDGQPLHDLPAKALELLCFLLLHREHAHTRETLAEVLWPGASYLQSKKYLRQTLWQLQTELVGAGLNEETESLISLNPGWVGINPKANWWLDVDTLERAYAQCLDSHDGELTEAQAQCLEEAIALYEGDLIETWYQDWCIYERERLQLIYLAMLEKLMGYCETQQHYSRGVTYGQRILRYDPAHENTHCHLMRLYCKAGDRTTALRQYDRCVAALAKEFSLPPCRETKVLYEQIRAECLDAHTPTQPLNSLLRNLQPDADLQQQLGHMHAYLSALQQQIQQGLALMGQMLTAPAAPLPPESKTSQQIPHQTH